MRWEGGTYKLGVVSLHLPGEIPRANLVIFRSILVDISLVLSQL